MSLPLDLSLSQLKSVDTPTFYIIKILFNNILPPAPKSPKWTLLFRFSNQNFEYPKIIFSLFSVFSQTSFHFGDMILICKLLLSVSNYYLGIHL